MSFELTDLMKSKIEVLPSDEVLVKLFSDKSDPDNGIIGVQTSLGRAIKGCEKNEVVEYAF